MGQGYLGFRNTMLANTHKTTNGITTLQLPVWVWDVVDVLFPTNRSEGVEQLLVQGLNTLQKLPLVTPESSSRISTVYLTSGMKEKVRQACQLLGLSSYAEAVRLSVIMALLTEHQEVPLILEAEWDKIKQARRTMEQYDVLKSPRKHDDFDQKVKFVGELLDKTPMAQWPSNAELKDILMKEGFSRCLNNRTYGDMKEERRQKILIAEYQARKKRESP